MELIISSVGAALAAICYFCQAGAWRTQEIAAKAAPTVCHLIVLFYVSNSIFAQPYGDPDQGQPGDAMIQAYLAGQASSIHDTFLKGIETKEDWLAQKPAWKNELHHMLGLSPLPEKSPLQATITGTLERDGYTVDMLHYQSRPGLYVTGNLYRPSSYKKGDRLPAILYVCGHGSRGRNGNKTAYQSHGIWYAKHGYICLIVDTLQMGEIAAIHHGTYREERWWWHSRGYTSAGVECWNGVRGIDYLVSRPDVDPDRIGVTGRSGGGAATFWIAAADERVKASSAVSGMADLPSYVNNRVINGHCDCMFMYNTFEWPWVRIAGLVAPRPLLFVNGDVDPIFPMDANQRLINRMESIYSLFGASDQVDAVVSKGGHSSREDIRKATYRFMNIHLKQDALPVLDSERDLVTGPRGQEVHPIEPEQLRVFPTDADIPKNELNTTIDLYFVPMAKLETPKPDQFDAWKKDLIGSLKEVTIRGFPKRIPAAEMARITDSGNILLETEPGISITLKKVSRTAKVDRVVLHVGQEPPHDSVVDGQFPNSTTIYKLSPRGTSDTQWTRRNPPNYVERAHVLLGQSVAEGQIRDIIATARFLKERHGEDEPLHVSGKGPTAVLAAYAALLEPSIDGALLDAPRASHMQNDCPPLLNVLRVCDVPDVLGALAPKPLRLIDFDERAALKVESIYKAAGASDQLESLGGF
ncbi:MAG: prolyl oligopeptidase family serine peptidase [Opitutales bacterium]|nr:prolyl oligopeptidase family serine peptidase [Opitutales bacterium]